MNMLMPLVDVRTGPLCFSFATDEIAAHRGFTSGMGPMAGDLSSPPLLTVQFIFLIQGGAILSLGTAPAAVF